jgi:hypothetical protein
MVDGIQLLLFHLSIGKRAHRRDEEFVEWLAAVSSAKQFR